jgi:hypothetical protein
MINETLRNLVYTKPQKKKLQDTMYTLLLFSQKKIKNLSIINVVSDVITS